MKEYFILLADTSVSRNTQCYTKSFTVEGLDLAILLRYRAATPDRTKPPEATHLKFKSS